MVWFSLWVFLTLVTPIWGAGRVEGLYLSFGQDPCTSMQVSWLGGEGRVRAEYRAMGDRAWREQDGERLERELPLCRVQLKALRPDTEYLLRIEGMQGGIRRFRTMPRALTREVRFVVAGDGLRQRRRFQQVKERICLAKPDFVVIGGDIAYAVRGRRSTRGSAAKWRAFVRHWSDARTSEGRLIPLLFVVGNHDAAHHEAQTFALLAGEDRTYRAVDLGGYLSLFLLDTGHVAPLEGAQTRWLGEVLQQRAQVPCKIAVYHVAAFPSVYSYEGRVPSQIRALWAPLFERHGVTLAFEHHNHAYKRTFPIKGLQRDPTGVVYVGDGAWGVVPRAADDTRWYLHSVGRCNHFCLVTVHPEGCSVHAIDAHGELIDRVRRRAL